MAASGRAAALPDTTAVSASRSTPLRRQRRHTVPLLTLMAKRGRAGCARLDFASQRPRYAACPAYPRAVIAIRVAKRNREGALAKQLQVTVLHTNLASRLSLMNDPG